MDDTPMLRLYRCVFLFHVLVSSYAFAEFSSQQRMHSLFNSELLRKNEVLLDLLPWGSMHFGVTNNLELGTSTFFLMGKIPNAFLKHRMFTLGRSETSFSSFTLFAPKKSYRETSSSSSFFSLFGIVTSYNVDSRLYFNAGLMRAYSLTHSIEEDRSLGDVHSRFEGDAYAAVLGTEYYFSSKWALKGFILLPLYIEANLVSDVGDASASIVPNSKLYRYAYLGNVSLARSWNIFNLEFGVLRVSAFNIPYVSVFWRIR